MNRVVKRSAAMLVLVAILAGGMIFFVADYVMHSGDWVLSEGSPHVYTDYSSVCGVITDRDGTVLMDTSDGRVYADDELLRKSIIHWLGDRQGNIPPSILHYYAAKMTKHDVVNGLYVYGNDGGQIKLTLSAQVQKAALEALGNYKGTVAVYNYKTGEILCAVSTPTFDPDNVPDIAGDPETYAGAYLNRFLYSAYTPGSIFKTVTLAAALDQLENRNAWSYTCTGSVSYGIDSVTCMISHGTQNLADAFRNSCNCAFSALADEIGAEMLQQYAVKLGITSTVSFDGITTTPGNISMIGEPDVLVAWSSIGQHKDLVNPCQYMTMMGAIASGGMGPKPYIVAEIDGGGWGTYTAQTEYGDRILSEDTAELMGRLLRNNVASYYGDWNFPGLKVCAKTGSGEVGGTLNSTFAGFVQDEEYPLAFIAVVEDGSYGQVTCIPIIAQVLEACKQVLDGE